MRILLISDVEEKVLWDHWKQAGAQRLEGIQLILSAGDLKPEYLEFLVTMTSVPLLYVRGNHDSVYDAKPPEGCMHIDDRLVYAIEDRGTGHVTVAEDARAARKIADNLLRETDCKRSGNTPKDNARTEEADITGVAKAGEKTIRLYRIAGLGGSLRYRKGSDMFTDREMAARVHKLRRKLRRSRSYVMGSEADLDILLTHAPCLGHGDLSDLPHRGFACFNRLLEDYEVAMHCYGHVHMNYDRLRRETEHPSGTRLVNCCGMHIVEI